MNSRVGPVVFLQTRRQTLHQLQSPVTRHSVLRLLLSREVFNSKRGISTELLIGT